MRPTVFLCGLVLLTGLLLVLLPANDSPASSAPSLSGVEAATTRAADAEGRPGRHAARAALPSATTEPERPEDPAPGSAANTKAGLPYGKLADLYAKESPDPEWTRNSEAMAESFLTEAGLEPEALTHVECRQTLCKIELKPGLSMHKIVSATVELEHSGIPVSAQFEFGESGTLHVRGAFVAKEGFEQQIQSMIVKPSPDEQAAAQAQTLEQDDVQE